MDKRNLAFAQGFESFFLSFQKFANQLKSFKSESWFGPIIICGSSFLSDGELNGDFQDEENFYYHRLRMGWPDGPLASEWLSRLSFTELNKKEGFPGFIFYARRRQGYFGWKTLFWPSVRSIFRLTFAAEMAHFGRNYSFRHHNCFCRKKHLLSVSTEGQKWSLGSPPVGFLWVQTSISCAMLPCAPSPSIPRTDRLSFQCLPPLLFLSRVYLAH